MYGSSICICVYMYGPFTDTFSSSCFSSLVYIWYMYCTHDCLFTTRMTAFLLHLLLPLYYTHYCLFTDTFPSSFFRSLMYASFFLAFFFVSLSPFFLFLSPLYLRLCMFPPFLLLFCFLFLSPLSLFSRMLPPFLLFLLFLLLALSTLSFLMYICICIYAYMHICLMYMYIQAKRC